MNTSKWIRGLAATMIGALSLTTMGVGVANADCEPKCKLPEVCRYEAAGGGSFYCALPTYRPKPKPSEPSEPTQPTPVPTEPTAPTPDPAR